MNESPLPVVRYELANEFNPKPFIKLNHVMLGEDVETIALRLRVAKTLVIRAINEDVPKADFIAKVLYHYPKLKFYDAFTVLLESDGVMHAKTVIPLPYTFAEAVNAGLQLENGPMLHSGDDAPAEQPRIVIRENNEEVLGIFPDNTLARYPKTGKSAMAQLIIQVRKERGLDV